MADAASSHASLKLKFHCDDERSDRGSTFWDPVTVMMKFKFEPKWLEAVNAAEGKPDLSMRGKLEDDIEDLGYKLTIVGPLIDFYLRHISKGIKQRLRKSSATGLMNPVSVLIPFDVMKYICVFWRNYGGKLQTSGNKMEFTAQSKTILDKIFSAQRFDGSSCLWKRHYKRIRRRNYHGKTTIEHFLTGRSVVVVSKNTPFSMTYNIKSGMLKVSFYRQNYNAEGIAQDMTLQRQLNS